MDLADLIFLAILFPTLARATNMAFKDSPDLRDTVTFICAILTFGCVLGVLFEDSVAVYFEWVTEDEAVVDYPPPVRYKSWPKSTVAGYIRRGVWEAEPVRPLPTA